MDDYLSSNSTFDEIVPKRTWRLGFAFYIKPIFLSVFFGSIAWASYIHEHIYVAGAFGFLSFMYGVYHVLYALFVKVSIDEEGVWITRGLFPWQRDTAGVAWRDIGGASYQPGFFQWLTNCYSITIDHKRTGSAMLKAPLVSRGKSLCGIINSLGFSYGEN